MCGIVAAISSVGKSESVSDFLLEGLARLEYRGYDSCGIALISEDMVDVHKTTSRVKSLKDQAQTTSVVPSIGIGHTRWATHGKPCEVNAHPHISVLDTGTVAVVHNGIIENYRELKQKLERLGFVFESQTDTEVVAHLIAYHLKTDLLGLEDAVTKSVKELAGSFALAVVYSGEPDVLIGARLGSPLVIGRNQSSVFLSSDMLTLADYAQDAAFLNDFDIVTIKQAEINVKNIGGNPNKLNWDIGHIPVVSKGVSALEGGTHMEAEIKEQVTAIVNCADKLSTFDSSKFLETIRASKIDSVLILACGTSYYAGCLAKYWIESMAGVSATVEVASEYRYRKPVAKKHCLTIVISQSGETADTLAALRYAKSIGSAKLSLAVCNVASSSMVKECDYFLNTNAGVEVGVASTKAFTAQLTCLNYLVELLGTYSNKQQPGIKHKNYLSASWEASRGVESVVAEDVVAESELKQVAKFLSQYQSMLFLGRGYHYHLAQEGALKLKEISYIHAQAYSAGELKHGPLALVCDKLPVVILVPDDEHLDKLASNIQEVKARNGLIVLLVQESVLKKLPGLSEDGMFICKFKDTSSELACASVFAAALQLVALHTAQYLGKDVDKPRNLAKSVTVE